MLDGKTLQVPEMLLHEYVVEGVPKGEGGKSASAQVQGMWTEVHNKKENREPGGDLA